MLDIQTIVDPHQRAQWMYDNYIGGTDAPLMLEAIANSASLYLRDNGLEHLPPQECAAISGTIACVYLYSAVVQAQNLWTQMQEIESVAYHGQHALHDHADTPDPMVVAVFGPCDSGDLSANTVLSRLTEWVTGELASDLATEADAFVASVADSDE